MFESISRGWSLTKASFRVLKLDKEILVLPILSGIVLLAVWMTFIVPFAALGLGDNVSEPVLLGLLFVVYVLSYFVVIWFNTAIVEMATIRFNGGDPVLKDGLKMAWNRKFRILQWAIVAATVGLILKILENAARRADNVFTQIVGQIAVWIAGAAWNAATFFVVPVIVHRDLGPMDAIKASWATIRRAWGETFTGAIGTTLIFFLLSLLAIPIFFLGAMIWFPLGLMLGAVWLVGVWAAGAAVDAILVAGLYQYAETGQLPEAFGQQPSAVVA